jgi:hypothetical protein
VLITVPYSAFGFTRQVARGWIFFDSSDRCKQSLDFRGWLCRDAANFHRYHDKRPIQSRLYRDLR